MARSLNNSQLARRGAGERLRGGVQLFRGWFAVVWLLGLIFGLVFLASWFPGTYPRRVPRELVSTLDVAPFVLAGLALLIDYFVRTEPQSAGGGKVWRRPLSWSLVLALWGLTLLTSQAGNLSRLPAIWQAGDWPRLAVGGAILAVCGAFLGAAGFRALKRPVLLAVDFYGIAAPEDGIDRLGWRSVAAVVIDPAAMPFSFRVVLAEEADRSGLREGWPDIDEIEVSLRVIRATPEDILSALRTVVPWMEIRPPRAGLLPAG